MESFLTVSLQGQSRASSTHHVISSTSKVLAWLESNLSSDSNLPSREYLDSNPASWVVRGRVLEDRLVRLNSRRRTVVRRDGELDKRRRMVQAMAKQILNSSAERTLDITISSVHSTSAGYFVLSHHLTTTPREPRRDVPRQQHQPVSNIRVTVGPVVPVPIVSPVVPPVVPPAVPVQVPWQPVSSISVNVGPVGHARIHIAPAAGPTDLPVVPRDDPCRTRHTELDVEHTVTDLGVTRVTPRPANTHRDRRRKTTTEVTETAKPVTETARLSDISPLTKNTSRSRVVHQDLGKSPGADNECQTDRGQRSCRKSRSRLQAIRNVFSKLTASRTSRGTLRTVTTQTSPRLLRMPAQISAVDRKDYFTDVGLKCSRC